MAGSGAFAGLVRSLASNGQAWEPSAEQKEKKEKKQKKKKKKEEVQEQKEKKKNEEAPKQKAVAVAGGCATRQAAARQLLAPATAHAESVMQRGRWSTHPHGCVDVWMAASAVGVDKN